MMTQPPVPARDLAAAYRGVPVLVQGAAGFIGRWVSRLLSKTGARLHLTARDPRSAAQVFARYGIQGSVHPLDILDARAVKALHRTARPAITFNLVGYGVDHSERNPDRAMDVNAQGVRNMLSAIEGTRPGVWRGCRLVHVGSGAEYGARGGPFQEDGPEVPESWYGRSKLEGTRTVREWVAETGLSALTARPFTVYGPGEHAGRLLPTLLNAARSGASIPLTEGYQRRDFVYVVDVAEALLRLGLAHDCADGGAVNVATGQVTTVRRFALTAARVLGIDRDRLDFGALASGRELDHDAPTTDRLRRCTGRTPGTGLEEGVRRTQRLMDRIGE